MEVSMSLNALVHLPLSSSRTTQEGLLVRHSFTSRRTAREVSCQQQGLVVRAKGKRGGGRPSQERKLPPSLPKIEEDGNPKFVIFIRMANVYLWYPLSIITGGTTAKIMVAAKDNFLGKYIYKDTLARNLAAVIYRDEKEIQKTALKQFRVLRSATEFRYGYKLVTSTNLRAALSTSDVIELPREEELKTVLDNVKDFFGNAKESFGKITALNSTDEPVSEGKPQEKSKQPCCDKIGLKRGPWTIEEDRKLMHFILNNGIQCWRLVPKLAGLMRCGKSCRLRWINYLRPDLKRGALTDAEEDMIIQLHSRFGNRWSKIASHFPGRTDNEIKNYWNTRIKKKLKHLGVDPITHEPILEPENINSEGKESFETNSSKEQKSKSTELDSQDDDGEQILKRDGLTEVGQCEQNNSFPNTEDWENTNLKQAATNEFSVDISGQTFDDFYEQWIRSPNDMLPWDSFSNFDEILLNIPPNMDGTHL